MCATLQPFHSLGPASHHTRSPFSPSCINWPRGIVFDTESFSPRIFLSTQFSLKLVLAIKLKTENITPVRGTHSQGRLPLKGTAFPQANLSSVEHSKAAVHRRTPGQQILETASRWVHGISYRVLHWSKLEAVPWGPLTWFKVSTDLQKQRGWCRGSASTLENHFFKED